MREEAAFEEATLREATILRAVASGIFCGVLFWLGMLATRGTSYHGWDASDLLLVAGMLLATLALSAWSVFALARWRSSTLVWTRRVIQCHCVCAIIFVLLSCSHHEDLLHLPSYAKGAGGTIGTIAVLADLTLLALTPTASSDPETLRLYRKIVLIVAGGALLAAAVWPFAVVGLVATEAEIIALGRPYCIQVPTKRDGYAYAAASSLADFHGLRMRPSISGGGTRDAYLAFNAVLVVQTQSSDPELWNWSYLQGGFVPISDRTRKALYLTTLDCTPKPHFVRQLPIYRAPMGGT